MLLNVSGCPRCGGTSFAVEVKTWLNVEPAEDHSGEYPRFVYDSFDDEDGVYAEAIDDADIICRDCHHQFKNTAPAEVEEE